MQNKRFSKNDDGFICVACGYAVAPLKYTSRDHCPKCLCSLHVDVNPGDRDNNCMGLLRPVEIEYDSRKGNVIVFKCDKCGEIKKNKAADDDDFEMILKVSNRGFEL